MTDTAKMSERELADYYNDTHDVSGFDGQTAVPVQVRRDVTISVRFSAEEIETVRAAADTAGVKVTALIRAAALHSAATDEVGTDQRLAQLGELVTDIGERLRNMALSR